jgi:hypothetical protein
MNFNKLFFLILEEENILKTTKTKPIVDAIKNRYPISFYYSGPRKPKKDSVRAGNRVKAEAVALGLSKKGYLILRAWVQPPSISKKGFSEHGWRTFMVGRMKSVQVMSDETFDTKRPQYKEGDDRSMSVTYVTSDWTKTPKTKPIEKPTLIKGKPTKVEPIVKPTEPTPVEPKKPEELPQPTPQSKPSKTPEVPKPEPQLEPQPEPQPEEPKQPDELPQPKQSEPPIQNPEEKDEDELLNESIRKIKHLMFS